MVKLVASMVVVVIKKVVSIVVVEFVAFIVEVIGEVSSMAVVVEHAVLMVVVRLATIGAAKVYYFLSQLTIRFHNAWWWSLVVVGVAGRFMLESAVWSFNA